MGLRTRLLNSIILSPGQYVSKIKSTCTSVRSILCYVLLYTHTKQLTVGVETTANAPTVVKPVTAYATLVPTTARSASVVLIVTVAPTVNALTADKPVRVEIPVHVEWSANVDRHVPVQVADPLQLVSVVIIVVVAKSANVDRTVRVPAV